jgi:hypothetical protein
MTVSVAAAEDDSFYTISIQNRDTGETMSETPVSGDTYDTWTASFDGVVAGEYDIVVSYFYAEGGHSSTCATTQWTCEADSSIKVNYYVVTDEIEVVLADDNNDDDVNVSEYTVVLADAQDPDGYSKTVQSDEKDGIVSASFDEVATGEYNIIVYRFNEEGGNNSLCAITTWTCEENSSINVNYNVVTDEIEVVLADDNNDDDDVDVSEYTVVLADAQDPDGYSKTVQSDEIDGVVLAGFVEVVTGEYNILVYRFNEEGGNNSLCASTTWTCEAPEYLYDDITVSYNPSTDEISVDVTNEENSVYQLLIKDSNGSEVSNNILVYVDEEARPYEDYNLVTYLYEIYAGNYTAQVVDAKGEAVGDEVPFEISYFDEVDIYGAVIYMNSSTKDLKIEQIDAYESSHFNILISDASTGEGVVAQDMTPDDLNEDCYYSIIDGLSAKEYTISIYNFDKLLASQSWKCETHDEDSLEAIQVSFNTATNEIEVIDLGATITEPIDTGNYVAVIENAEGEPIAISSLAPNDEGSGAYYGLFEGLSSSAYYVSVYTNGQILETIYWECEDADNDTDDDYTEESIEVWYYVLSNHIAIVDLGETIDEPVDTGDYVAVIEETKTGETVAIKNLAPNDENGGIYYRLVEGLPSNNYEISIYTNGELMTSLTWKCTVQAGGATEAIEVWYYVSSNSISILDLGKTTEENCNHKNTTIKTVKATYFAKGKNIVTCKTCGKVIKTTVIPKKVLKTPTVSVKSAKKSIKVTYKKKVAGATGIQIAYKLSGSKKYVVKTFKTSKAVTKTIKSLKANKKYNVRVRTYIKSGNKKAYSSWTTVKTVKVKK